MSDPVTVPLWLFLPIAAFALWSLLDRLLIPSGRWFLRRRLNRLIDRVNRRLDVETDEVVRHPVALRDDGLTGLAHRSPSVRLPLGHAGLLSIGGHLGLSGADQAGVPASSAHAAASGSRKSYQR